MQGFNKARGWGEFVNNQQEKYYKCKDVIINFKDCIDFIESKVTELKQNARLCKGLVKRCHQEIKKHNGLKGVTKIKKIAEHQWADARAIEELSNKCIEIKNECWSMSKQWRTVDDVDQYVIDSSKKMEEYYEYLSSIDNMMEGFQTITDELQQMIIGLEDKTFVNNVGPFQIPEIRNIILDECAKVDMGSISQIAQLNKFWNENVTSQNKYQDIIETQKELDKINYENWSDSSSDCSEQNNKCMTADEWGMCYPWEVNSRWGYDSDDFM